MVRFRPWLDGPSIGPPRRGRFDSWVARAFALLVAAALGTCGGTPDSPSAPAPPSAPARRIVSLAPSHTELLFALGAGDAVIGVTRFCDRPPEARTHTVVGDAQRVNLEVLAALAPDLVVVNAVGVEEALGPMRERVRVLAVPTDTLPQLLDAVGVLGAAAGRGEAARALRVRMEAALDEARRRNAGRPRTRVLVVVQHDPFFVAGAGSYVDALLKTVACENAAGDLAAAWPTISAEAVLARMPDAIVDAALGPTGRGGDDSAVKAWWGRYPMLPAVKDGRVRALRDEAAIRPGPDLAGALRALEDSIAAAPAAGAGK